MKHKDIEIILDILKVDEHVLLVGPTGCGKTHLSKQIADELNLPFYSTNAITEEYKLLGYKDIQGVYNKTDFIRSIENGGVFLMDELDASIPEALLLINTALANGYINTPNGRYDVHKDFKCIATANTIDGANNTYTGRNKLDAATINRFIIVETDYDKDLELKIISNILNDQQLKSNYVFEVLMRLRDYNQILSTRNIVQICKLINSNSNSYKNVLRSFEELDIYNSTINHIEYMKTETFEKANKIYGVKSLKDEYIKRMAGVILRDEEKLMSELIKRSYE